jgi:hypothetical protein
MPFTANQINELHQSARGISRAVREILLAYPRLPLRSERAIEFMNHGFLRRFMTLDRCVQNIFRLLPPELEAVPDSETRKDAEISIQAFVFNAFGALDNLAWIWVEEAGIRKPNGNALSKHQIGLHNRCDVVRASLSDAARASLEGFDAWFENLEDFRHSLAHRIPLYIPPFGISEDDEPQYTEFERLKNAALAEMNPDEYVRLDALQAQLSKFQPIMTHSLGENASKIVFHAQIIADFNTVEAIRAVMFSEIEAYHNRVPAEPNP